ncbi:MAG: phosphotransferase family protein [Acidobacteria bacterium]|nr:phosphotransferase family protein [Acidobacteriota bacterium]
MDEQELRSVVAEMLGAEVTAFEHNAAGSSRQTYMAKVARAGDTVDVVVRHDIGSGPFSGSAFTLPREAELLAAIAGHGLPAPRCLGISDDGTTELLERLPGASAFVFASPEEHAAVGRQYVELVAALHTLDLDALDLPNVPRPTSPVDHALVDLAQWDDFVTRRRMTEADPTLAVASAWLHEHAPTSVQRTSLIHGDCGPGNLLHQGGNVTGMIDWELAHIGDPMDDLAWWWFREDLHDVRTDIAQWYRWYAGATGLDIDLDRIHYYRVFVLYRTSIATCADHTLVAARPYMVGRLAMALQERGVHDPAADAAAAPFAAMGLKPIAVP